jgi:pyruvate,water dikinase
MSYPMNSPNYAGASPGTEKVRQKYQGLQSLLGENSRLLEIMADLEADLRFLPLGSASLEHQIQSLFEGTLLIIEDLNRLAEGRYGALYKAYLQIERQILQTLKESKILSSQSWVIPLSEVGFAQEAEVGGKAARLGELKKAFPELVPEGFVATTRTYQTWVSEPIVATEVRALLDTLEVSSDRERFSSKAARIREIIQQTSPPKPVQDAILGLAQGRWPPSQRWAVRSSAVGEDTQSSFAGQFESFLNVPTPQLIEAYQGVLASRFSERAISYRLLGAYTEAGTPMAVLFMPVIEARRAGVLYTRDPARPGEDQMLVSSTWGLAGELVAGQAPADLFRVNRKEPSRILETRVALKKDRLILGEHSQFDRQENTPEDQRAPSLNPDEVAHLAAYALAIENHFSGPQDIEWALDPNGRFWILQARPLRLVRGRLEEERPVDRERPILSGGLTIFPGRAVAPILVISNPRDLPPLSSGVILVVPQATPEISAVLTHLAGFIAEQGHPTGHAATLLREFAIPSLFEVHGATQKLASGTRVGLDATRRQVFLGIPWPGIQERTRARLARPKPRSPSTPLSDLILNLRMTDPMARSFKPERCQSIHDLIRFVHEKGVAALFEVGDQEARRKGVPTRRLTSSIPLDIWILDLGNALTPEGLPHNEVSPEEILSIPFEALWRGVAHPRVSWAGRREMSVKGFASVVASSLSQDMGAMRKLGDPNYLLVAPDYMSLNIRLAYHYAMIDALVGAVTENNYVNFRFRGGGSSPPRRDLRARFLTEVLTRSRFHVDRRGDLVTAWLRRYPQGPSEAGLELLGKLMACARQLDMLMDSESIMLHFVDRFLAGDYEAFA